MRHSSTTTVFHERPTNAAANRYPVTHCTVNYNECIPNILPCQTLWKLYTEAITPRSKSTYPNDHVHILPILQAMLNTYVPLAPPILAKAYQNFRCLESSPKLLPVRSSL